MDEAEILRLGSVASTQDVARALPIGSIVLADHQTAGRGRHDRRWESPPGTALLASFVLAPRQLLSLAAGIAAAEACGPQVRLKWPNDLLLDGRKLGGVLVEVHGAKAVLGIGINLSWAPEGAAMLGRPRDEVFGRLASELTTWTAATDESILARWRRLSATLGRRVRLDISGQVTEGVARDIGPRGELIVDGQSFVAGSVTHL